MQSGELIVTGTNSITIQINTLPAEVKVHFKDHIVMTPCNPQNEDSVEYEIHTTNTSNSKFVLIIKWSVSSVREISWHVAS